MPAKSEPRFNAEKVERLATVNEGHRFEMEFCDCEGRKIVVSVPCFAAVEMGCTICDMWERAPYLIGGVHTGRGGGRP
jgi:hypothetical protein